VILLSDPVPVARRRPIRAAHTVVTDAAPPASSELRSRQVRYGVTMAFRTACFLAMIWVPGPARWFLLAAAAILPYIAVVAASQADRRTGRSGLVAEIPRLAIDTGPGVEGAPNREPDPDADPRPDHDDPRERRVA
jgi:Protein of unknown function (DUF3099)